MLARAARAAAARIAAGAAASTSASGAFASTPRSAAVLSASSASAWRPPPLAAFARGLASASHDRASPQVREKRKREAHAHACKKQSDRAPAALTPLSQPLHQALARLAASRPASLAVPPSPADPPSEPPPDTGALRRALLTLGGFYSAESRAIRAAQAWHGAVVSAAAGPGATLARSAGLDPARFADTHALLGLHLWLALVRLRAEGEPGKAVSQALYENFSDDVEARVRAAGVRVRVSKWLSELERMFYGAATAYDAAVGAIGGGGESGKDGGATTAPQPLPGGAPNAQAALAAALLRNVYAGDEARSADAGALARYALRELACLALTESGAVLAGRVRFSGALAGREAEAGSSGGEEALAASAPTAAA